MNTELFIQNAEISLFIFLAACLGYMVGSLINKMTKPKELTVDDIKPRMKHRIDAFFRRLL